MEETVKITHAKNMNKLNFNLTISMPVDTNSNIKKILNIDSYIFDQKVECGSGKAIISGKVGTKVLYLDTDNMTGTLSNTTNFNETMLESTITNNTYINVCDSTIINNILSTEGNLKINCDVSLSPVEYINLALSNKVETNDFLVNRKSKLNTNSISQFVNTKFDHAVTLETKDTINKILYYKCCLIPEKTTAQDGYAVIEGKITTSLVYESIVNEDVIIKEIKDTLAIKCDVEIEGLTKENTLDLSFCIDRNNQEISTELEDDLSVVTIKNPINVCGVVTKTIEIDIVDDLYSTTNEIETNMIKRDFTKKAETFSVSETIFNEMSLATDETGIDEIVANLNQSSEVTNTYIKDNFIFLEGVVISNLIYIDENKEMKNKLLEVPFIINTKIQTESLSCVHSSVAIVDSKVKVKRGINIETEYSLYVGLFVYENETHEIVDNFKLGKQLDFSKYDFQIFIAKPNETIWDLCKRIKIIPDDLHKHNKDLPLIMEGGEKIIIKR